MSENILTVFNENNLDANEITSLEMGINSKTGESFARARMSDGTSYIQRLTRTGIRIGEQINIPQIQGAEQRRNVITELKRNGYTQDEIASFCGISQSTVSNTLREK